MRRLLLATTNPGKQREFRRLLAHLPAGVVTPDELGLVLDVEEPYDTYAENASAKADAYARLSGLLTLADDSGLEVAALGGGPGVRTGRWGQGDGRDPDRMIEAVAGAADRGARMVCVLAIGLPSDGDHAAPRIELFEG
ncbi:MAG: non-canonical purine NTP pyrophosphatase, partial [Chloroflexi bacterium]|nr:non-canonical purine NTP pyrophosphatase [Chloroflexota bacterium]